MGEESQADPKQPNSLSQPRESPYPVLQSLYYQSSAIPIYDPSDSSSSAHSASVQPSATSADPAATSELFPTGIAFQIPTYDNPAFPSFPLALTDYLNSIKDLPDYEPPTPKYKKWEDFLKEMDLVRKVREQDLETASEGVKSQTVQYLNKIIARAHILGLEEAKMANLGTVKISILLETANYLTAEVVRILSDPEKEEGIIMADLEQLGRNTYIACQKALKSHLYLPQRSRYDSSIGTLHPSDSSIKTKQNSSDQKSFRERLYAVHGGIDHVSKTVDVSCSPSRALIYGHRLAEEILVFRRSKSYVLGGHLEACRLFPIHLQKQDPSVLTFFSSVCDADLAAEIATLGGFYSAGSGFLGDKVVSYIYGRCEISLKPSDAAFERSDVRDPFQVTVFRNSICTSRQLEETFQFQNWATAQTDYHSATPYKYSLPSPLLLRFHHFISQILFGRVNVKRTERFLRDQDEILQAARDEEEDELMARAWGSGRVETEQARIIAVSGDSVIRWREEIPPGLAWPAQGEASSGGEYSVGADD